MFNSTSTAYQYNRKLYHKVEPKKQKILAEALQKLAGLERMDQETTEVYQSHISEQASRQVRSRHQEIEEQHPAHL